MLFFQLVLLLGYLYAFCLTRYFAPRTQVLVHLVLMTLSVAALPLTPRPEAPAAGPVAAILASLAWSVGLPYFVMSATSPLVQSWVAALRGAHLPYRLFALSNAAALVALVAYPVAIEPFSTTRAQMAVWSAAYVLLLILLAIAAAITLRQARPLPQPTANEEASPWRWIALAACASTLWLAVTNYLGQQVAAMPFLWVAPMAVYLLTFVLCFEAEGWYRPALFRWLMPAAWAAIGSRIALEGSAGGLHWEIPVFCAALFICCMFCHGELARTRPAPHGLAFFYLMVACGGAAGGVFVGLLAPRLFSTFLELPLGVTASVLLAFYFLYGYRSPRRLLRLALVAALAFAVSTRYHPERQVDALAQFLRFPGDSRDGRGPLRRARPLQRTHHPRPRIPLPRAAPHPDDLLRSPFGRGPRARVASNSQPSGRHRRPRRRNSRRLRPPWRSLPLLRDRSGSHPRRPRVLRFSPRFARPRPA